MNVRCDVSSTDTIDFRAIGCSVLTREEKGEETCPCKEHSLRRPNEGSRFLHLAVKGMGGLKVNFHELKRFLYHKARFQALKS